MASRFATRFDARPLSTPNLAPMIGVLLAVFTVVATGSVGLEKAMKLDSPGCFLGWLGVHRARPIQISIQHDGQAYVGAHRAASIGDAVAIAIHEARTHGGNGVQLRADPDVRYEVVALAVKDLNDAGVAIGFINEDIR